MTTPSPEQSGKNTDISDDPEFAAGLQLFDETFELVAPKLPLTRQDPDRSVFESVKRYLGSNNLYHYTTAEGLQGIVEKGCFYASAAYFMNDSSEIDYGCELFGSLLAEWCQEHEDDDSPGAVILRYMKERFSDLTEMRHVLARIYVVCFCEEANLLSQWRAYGQKGGYSIGFGRDALETFRTDAPGMNIALEKVIYDAGQQRNLLKVILADGMQELNVPEVKRKFEMLTPKGTAMFLRLFASLLDILALREVVRFKHPAFEDEREWRLIAVPRTRWRTSTIEESEFVNFRPSRGVPTPYLELKPKDELLPIASARYGPTLDKKLVEHSLKLLLKKHRYPEVPIHGADIPVRL